MTNHLDIDALVLKSGGHNSPEDGLCMMEAVAYFAHEPHSDHPACVSRVLAAFLRRLNDDLDDDNRQKLKAYIPRVVGTGGDREADERRAWMAADWMLHVHLPTWLDAAGMHYQATQVRALPTIDSWDAWQGTRSVVLPIRDAARALRKEKLAPIVEAVRAAVTKRLQDDAVAVAVAVAVAAAAAVAVAVADAAAAAAAAAVAVADAAAAADAVADADADADADAVADDVWSKVYRAVREVFRKAIAEDPRVGPVAAAMQDSGFELLDRMIEVGAPVPV